MFMTTRNTMKMNHPSKGCYFIHASQINTKMHVSKQLENQAQASSLADYRRRPRTNRLVYRPSSKSQSSMVERNLLPDKYNVQCRM